MCWRWRVDRLGRQVPRPRVATLGRARRGGGDEQYQRRRRARFGNSRRRAAGGWTAQGDLGNVVIRCSYILQPLQSSSSLLELATRSPDKLGSVVIIGLPVVASRAGSAMSRSPSFAGADSCAPYVSCILWVHAYHVGLVVSCHVCFCTLLLCLVGLRRIAVSL